MVFSFCSFASSELRCIHEFSIACAVVLRSSQQGAIAVDPARCAPGEVLHGSVARTRLARKELCIRRSSRIQKPEREGASKIEVGSTKEPTPRQCTSRQSLEAHKLSRHKHTGKTDKSEQAKT